MTRKVSFFVSFQLSHYHAKDKYAWSTNAVTKLPATRTAINGCLSHISVIVRRLGALCIVDDSYSIKEFALLSLSTLLTCAHVGQQVRAS